MGSYLLSMESGRSRPFRGRGPISAEDRKRLTDTFGTVPEEAPNEITIRSVMCWGRPWWRIHEIAEDRNARKDNLTDQDDLRMWLALLYTLAEQVTRLVPPSKYRGVVCAEQWREDTFQDSVGPLWQIIRAARGKNLGIIPTVKFAISRTYRAGTHKVPDEFDMEEFISNVRRVYPIEDEVAQKIDQEEIDRLMWRRISVRLEFRLPETLMPGIVQVYKNVRKGHQKTCRGHRWLLQMMTAHRRLVEHTLKLPNLPDNTIREVSDLFALTMMDADPESLMTELTTLVGADGAMRLVDIFGGMTIRVPSKGKLAEAAKRASIWVDYQGGKMTIEQIADKHAITPRKVMDAINRWAEISKASRSAGYAN